MSRKTKEPSMKWLKKDLIDYAESHHIKVLQSDTKRDILKKIPGIKAPPKKQYKGRGGYRGGGRPKGSKTKKKVKQEEAKKYFRERVRAEWDPIIDAYLNKALGCWKEKVVKWSNGKAVKKKVYQETPDRTSLNDLTTRVIGKPADEMVASIDIKNIQETEKTVKKILERNNKDK